MENNQPISTLRNLLDYDARNFIIAEIQLEKSLHDWIDKASSLQLKNVLQKYLGYVQQHIPEMNEFYENEKINSISISNRIMQAFIDETNEKLSGCQDSQVKDACLLACIQVINHYKISAFGTAAAFAYALEMEKEGGIFRQIEINEKQIDDRLSQLAEHEINARAKSPIVLP
jgi:ferritin-like metal-binding protein YciE